MRRALPGRLRLAARSARAAAWSISGTALLAVMVAVAVGGLTYALSAPAQRDQPTSGTPPPSENVTIALKAADDSRTMFGLLSDAVTSSTSGLTTAMSGAPKIFDSIDTAHTGAAQVATGLDSTTTAAAALDTVAQSVDAWSSTLDQIQGMAGLAAAARTSAEQLRAQLRAHPSPGSGATVANLDQVIAAADALKPLDSVSQLLGALTTLTALPRQSSATLTSARTAAHQLRDGLATLSRARPSAEAALSNLSLGVKQLGIALKSIDEQLALVQTRLRREARDEVRPVVAVEDDSSTRMAWALFTGGTAGAVSYLLALSATGRRRGTGEVGSRGGSRSPLDGLAREDGIVAGHAADPEDDTNPWLAVHFARPASHLSASRDFD